MINCFMRGDFASHFLGITGRFGSHNAGSIFRASRLSRLMKMLLRHWALRQNPCVIRQKRKLKVENWDEIKLHIMFNLQFYKFSFEENKRKLLATGNEDLCEGNIWHDNFWEVVSGILRTF